MKTDFKNISNELYADMKLTEFEEAFNINSPWLGWQIIGVLVFSLFAAIGIVTLLIANSKEIIEFVNDLPPGLSTIFVAIVCGLLIVKFIRRYGVQ